jgi:hypothetical protein
MIGSSCRIDPRRCPQCSFGFDIAAPCPEQVSEIERRGCIGGIAFHQNAVMALGFGNISDLLSPLSPRKQIIGIVLTLIDCKHKLAVFVGTSPRLLDFEAVAKSVRGVGYSEQRFVVSVAFISVTKVSKSCLLRLSSASSSSDITRPHLPRGRQSRAFCRASLLGQSSDIPPGGSTVV